MARSIRERMSALGSIVRRRVKHSDHFRKPGTAEVVGVDAVLRSEIPQLGPGPGFPVCAPAFRTWSVILDGHWPASGRPAMLDQQPSSHACASNVKRREFLTQRAW
jgi:hypothetical protein